MPPGALFSVFNGPAPTTAAPVAVTTGNAVKTLLQIATPATLGLTIIGWWCSFDASALATPIKVELCHTDVAATVTTYAAADISLIRGAALTSPSNKTSQITLGTSASGYTSSAEGTITSLQYLDGPQFIEQIGAGVYVQFPRDDEPVLPPSRFLRIRVTAGSAVNALCGVRWREPLNQ